jgi:hypothetical protein
MYRPRNLDIPSPLIRLDPFFNVSRNHRIRFGMETFETNSSFLKQVLKDNLKEDQTTDTTFISRYIINNKASDRVAALVHRLSSNIVIRLFNEVMEKK